MFGQNSIWQIFRIPSRNDHKGCKILLMTRRQQVCVSIKCHLRIVLNVLKEKEWLTLFKKHALALLKKHSGIDDDVFNSTLNEVAK